MADFRLNSILIEEKCQYLTAITPPTAVGKIGFWPRPWALGGPDLGLRAVQSVAGCVILGKLLHCSVPPFPQL